MAFLDPAISFAAILDPRRAAGAPPRVRPAPAPLPVVLGRASVVQPITINCLDLIKPEVEIDELRPAGCFVNADGKHVCQLDGADVEPLTPDHPAYDLEPTWPSMACGTLGTRFLAEGDVGSKLACERRQEATRRRCGAKLCGALLLALASVLLLSSVWTQLAPAAALSASDASAAEQPRSNVALEMPVATVTMRSRASASSQKTSVRSRLLERAHAYWQAKPNGGRSQHPSRSWSSTAPAEQPASMQLR
jgi:hypothetical protein